MRSSTIALFRDVLTFEGYPEPAVMDGCERGIHAVYWVAALLAGPSAAYAHLIVDYKLLGWAYVFGPLLYIPVALHWFPRSQTGRIIVNGVVLMAIGLSINSLHNWSSQPGIYVMLPTALIAYSIWGIRGLFTTTLLQMTAVVGTSVWFGMGPGGQASPSGVLTSMMLWVAVNLACAALIQQMLLSSRLRARELEAVTDKLMESESRLLENERSLRRIVSIGMAQIESAVDAVEENRGSSDNPGEIEAIRSAARSIRSRFDD